MAFVAIKVDEALKNDATVILEELGLDVPTAVRMYLKAIVRENDLPAAVKEECGTLPGAGRQGKRTPAGTAAPMPVKAAGTQDFIALICSVPVGGLTRWSDMEAFLSKKYGAEVRIPLRAEWPKINVEGLAIPYWRVVTDRGAVRADASCSKELREEMLKAEGHAFVPAGHGIFTGIKVADYKSKIVKF